MAAVWKRLITCCANCSQWPHQLQSLPNNIGRFAYPPKQKCRVPVTSYNCLRNFGSNNHNESPYDVLQVKANASKDEIKAAFRTLAKLHHPDLKRRSLLFNDNTDEDDDYHDNTMARLVNAYESLMSKYSASYLSSDATDSRVSLACEIYTIDELRKSPLFEVYSFRINYEHDNNRRSDVEGNNDTIQAPPTNHHQNNHLDPFPVLPISAHPQDSISDLKRCIQSKYATAWSLEDRKRDRDGLYLGWELICSSANNSHCVLSYHLFLDSYGIHDGDILHAVVRK